MEIVQKSRNDISKSILKILKTPFYVACKEGQLDVVELMLSIPLKALYINLNAQYVNGMTHFDLAGHSSGKMVNLLVQLLDTLE